MINFHIAFPEEGPVMYETHERDDVVSMENLLTNMINGFTTGNLMVMIVYSDYKMIILKSGV